MGNELNLLDKEEQKKLNAIRFITAAQEIMDSHGLESLSIRKIAEKAGFHNSTIYLYFEDLDELIMLASMKHFGEYSQSLEVQSKKYSSIGENFFTIWTLFAETMLKNPCVFYNFFFGKRSDNLQHIMHKYYQFFPEERYQFTKEIESMYFGKNILERSASLLQPLISLNCNVSLKKIDVINEMIVSYCKYKLEQKCQNPTLDSDTIKKQILEAITYIVAIPTAG